MILCVSDGWNERKGYNDIIKWADKLNDEVRFVIVGLDEKQIEKLPSNIIGLKRTQNIEQLVELYSAAEFIFLILLKKKPLEWLQQKQWHVGRLF